MGDARSTRPPSKLLVNNPKYDAPDEQEMKMENNYNMVMSRLSGLSHKDSNDRLLQMASEMREPVTQGLLFGLLTDKANSEKYLRDLSIAASDQWYCCLCNLNLIFFELYPKLQQSCRDQFIFFFRNAIKINVPKIDNVISNFVRNFNDGAAMQWNEKIRLVHEMATIFNESREWLMMLKPKSTLVPIVLYTFGRLAGDLPATGPSEPTRTAIANMIAFMVRSRPQEALILGRDLVHILMKLAKIPVMSALWKDMMTGRITGLMSIEDMMSRPCFGFVTQYRVSFNVYRKIEFLLNKVKPGHHEKHLEWFQQQHLRGPDQHSMRAELIRLALTIGWQEPAPTLPEARTQLLVWLLQGIPPTTHAAEAQWAKTALWWDWLGYEPPHTPFFCIEPVFGMLRFLVNGNPSMTALANSLFEFICKSATLLHPPMAERLTRNLNVAMHHISQHCGGPGVISPVLENVRLERGVRDGIREIWRDFVRAMPPSSSSAAAPSLTTSSAPSSLAGPSDETTPTRRKEKDVEKEQQRAKRKKVVVVDDDADSAVGSSVASGGEDDVSIVGEVVVRAAATEKRRSPPVLRIAKPEERAAREKELAGLMAELKDEIRPAMDDVRAAFKAGGSADEAVQLDDDEEDNERCEAVQRLLVSIFEHEEVLDENQLELIAGCLLLLWGDMCRRDGPLLPESLSDASLSACFTHPVYVVFRNLAMTPDGDSAREPLLSVIAAMRDRWQSVESTLLLLFFVKEMKSVNSDASSAYSDVASTLEKSTGELLAEDLQHCALIDDRLLAYLVPYVFGVFPIDVSEEPGIFKAICCHLDARQLCELIAESVRENVILFRKEHFVSIATASLGWATVPQWAFWQLVHAESVPLDWAQSLIPKLRYAQHAEACTNILLMFKRFDRDPTMALMRLIFSRPHDDDTFSVECIKILIEDPDCVPKVAELVATLLKKQLQAGDVCSPEKAEKKEKKKSPPKLYMEQVLHHMERFTQLCLTKDKRETEAMLSKQPLQDVFHTIKKSDKSNVLYRRFPQLFAVVEILNEDTSPPTRTLRGNRQATKPPKKSIEKDEEDEPVKKKRRPIEIDSDSD